MFLLYYNDVSGKKDLRHICDFSRVEASYKKSYYLIHVWLNENPIAGILRRV